MIDATLPESVTAKLGDDNCSRRQDKLAATITSTNGKRKADSELDREGDGDSEEKDDKEGGGDDDEGDDAMDDAVASITQDGQVTDIGSDSKPVSKNQLKRLKRQKLWEDRKEDRKLRRKEKRHSRQVRKHAEREAKLAEAEAAGLDREAALQALRPPAEKHQPVPVAFIIDCDFEQYMRENEIVSLSSQIVRSYAQNRKASHQAHLLVSSFKGQLKTRFETVLGNPHEKWRGVHVVEGDFVQAATLAQEVMQGGNGGKMIGLLRPASQPIGEAGAEDGEKDSIRPRAHGEADPKPVPEAEPAAADQSIVYLTSDSPYTLERLEANTSYIVGGLVDRNREKGLCYKRARERNVRTAKLPIGEYMAMQSRYVLTTNQVVEIMAKWLDCGDWAEAFMAIIPKRKGGKLKGDLAAENGDDTDGVDDHHQYDAQDGHQDNHQRHSEDAEEAGSGTDPAQETASKDHLPLPNPLEEI